MAEIVTFDPERHIPPEPCEWDAENYEFKGPPVVKQIKITTPGSPPEPLKH